MKQVTINLYSFNELSKEAKERAINEHLEFMDSLPEESENEDGEMVEEYVEHSEEDAIESIDVNQYLFFEDGEMAHILTYVGGHKRAGTTEFFFHGKTYDITELYNSKFNIQ
jgi:translation elongation factor EF-Ts